jgi:hypothetical protein
VGGDLRAHDGTVASLDLYRTNLYGQFYNSTSYSGLGTCAGNTTAPCYVSQYENLGLSRFEGVLLSLRHDVARGVYWSASGGLTRGFVVSVPPGFYNSGGTCVPSTQANCQNLNVVPNVNFNGTFPVSVPYAQARGSAGFRWSRNDSFGVSGTYYGNNNTYFRPAFMELDARAEHSVGKHASLALTFRNLTNVYGSAIQTFAASNQSGAPAVGGSPYALYGEEYGPRAAILTLSLHS